MQPERKLNLQEQLGILARLDFEEIYNAGLHAVYANSQSHRIVIHLTKRWDVPFNDFARQLAAVGISRVEVEAALESLYSDH